TSAAKALSAAAAHHPRPNSGPAGGHRHGHAAPAHPAAHAAAPAHHWAESGRRSARTAATNVTRRPAGAETGATLPAHSHPDLLVAHDLVEAAEFRQFIRVAEGLGARPELGDLRELDAVRHEVRAVVQVEEGAAQVADVAHVETQL